MCDIYYCVWSSAWCWPRSLQTIYYTSRCDIGRERSWPLPSHLILYVYFYDIITTCSKIKEDSASIAIRIDYKLCSVHHEPFGRFWLWRYVNTGWLCRALLCCFCSFCCDWSSSTSAHADSAVYKISGRHPPSSQALCWWIANDPSSSSV